MHENCVMDFRTLSKKAVEAGASGSAPAPVGSRRMGLKLRNEKSLSVPRGFTKFMPREVDRRCGAVEGLRACLMASHPIQPRLTPISAKSEGCERRPHGTPEMRPRKVETSSYAQR